MTSKMTIAETAQMLIRAVIVLLSNLRRARPEVIDNLPLKRSMSLSPGHAPDQDAGKRIYDESDHKQYEAELNECLPVHLGSGLGELIGYGGGDGKGRVEQPGRNLGSVPYYHSHRHGLADGASESQNHGS